MIDTLTSRSWLEIDLDAPSYNLNKLLALLHRETSLMAVVITDGYGHGLAVIAKQCQKLGIKAYAVATIDEGIKCPIIGRICMDQMLVDVIEVNDLDNNEIVIIVGNDGHNEIRIEELAQAAKTISNEILSQIGNRLLKVYVGGKGF